MEVRQIRDIKVLLSSSDLESQTVITGEPDYGDIIDVAATDQDWSRIQFERRNIAGSHLFGVVMAQAHIEEARITNSILENCDLASSRWINVKIDRCILRGCRLTGVHANGLTLSDVIFERCRLDYALLTGLQATGATALLDCLLREATIEDSMLDSVVLADCPMPGLQLANTRLRGADLRGSQLETLAGVICLNGAMIDTGQIHALTQAVLEDLQIQVKD